MREERLVEAISMKREEMIRIGMEKGLLSEETIICSQELDQLLNDYSRVEVESKQTNALHEYYEFLVLLQKGVIKFLRVRYSYLFSFLQN